MGAEGLRAPPYPGELGKRLDFLIQELHREANTLGSKSAALELTNISVEMKVAIEQMRERPQFVEISSAGMRESHVHDVQITKEAPNYHAE